MNRSHTQTERLLDLDQRLRENRYPNCTSFAADWEISTKTAQRDLDYLRERMGAPIEYNARERGYYYTETTFMLPAIQMNEGELVALLMASQWMKPFQSSAVADKLLLVFHKLAELMPDTITLRPEEIFTQFTVVAPPAMKVSPKVWETIVRALKQKRMLQISYPQTGEERRYRVSPVHLTNLHGDWYVFVQFEGYENFRQLALSRIQSAKLLRGKCDVVGDFDLDTELESTFSRFAGDNPAFEVKVRFSQEVAEEVLARQWHSKQKSTRLPDGQVDIQFQAKGDVEVTRWILAFGQHAQVMEPDWLRDRIYNEAKAMLRAR